MTLNIFKNKTALVTGASSGIGESFARLLAAQGCHLVVVARRTDRLEAIKAELESQHGVLVQVIGLDVSSHEAGEALFAQTEGAGITIDVLINNAGYGIQHAFNDSDLSAQLNSMDLMVRSLVDITHRFGRVMQQRKSGYILQVGSVASYLPVPLMATYGASKAFVRSFGRALNSECRAHNVHVTVLNPGGTLTEFFDTSGQSFPAWMTKLFFMSSEKTAEVGLIALAKNKPSVIAGAYNAVGMWMLKFVPERFHSAIAGVILK